MAVIDLHKLYRLPFSKNDNFNGWIEITTLCNIKCPGCYRGCDMEDHRGEHKNLDSVKQEILDLARIRNCSMISISGGEPLLHPDIKQIVNFIREQKINPVLFTNGKLLNTQRLLDLKKDGLTGVVMRIDSLQETGDDWTEEQLNNRRLAFADICNKTGIFLTFTSCISKNNLGQIKEIVNWAQANSAKAGQLILILKRQLVFKKEDILPDSEFVFAEQFLEQMKNDLPHLSFCAYLGSQAETQKPKWLQAFRYILNGKILGYADSKFVEFLQMIYHYKTGKYLGILKKQKNFVSIIDITVLSLLNKSMRTIAVAFLKQALRNPFLFFVKAAVQGITVVIPPHFVNGRRDLCDACPDAILYNGELVPSCALEEVSRFGRPFEID